MGDAVAKKPQGNALVFAQILNPDYNLFEPIIYRGG